MRPIWPDNGSLTMPDLALEMQGFFPGRGRQWRHWEDEFLKTFATEFGLKVSAETLRRPPADVALRISWLGIAMPADKVRLAPHGQAPKLEKKPAASSGSRAEAPEGWMTCAQVAELAGCSIGVVYSAIWKKRLDALQGDRGVWLVPEDAGREFAEARKAKTSEEASERPADAKEAPSIGNHKAEAKAEPPAPSGSKACTLDIVEPAGKAPTQDNLNGMSRLDILKAFARGEAVGGLRA